VPLKLKGIVGLARSLANVIATPPVRRFRSPQPVIRDILCRGRRTDEEQPPLMTTAATPPSTPPSARGQFRTVAELLHDLGDVPPERILFTPPPGTATEADLLRKVEAEDTMCELIDGTLVEKPVGLYESQIAAVLIHWLLAFVIPRRLGLVSAGDGPLRLRVGLVRLPDVAFFSAARLPPADVRNNPIPSLAPDLAIEVLSKGNTRREIQRKIGEYFTAGGRLVWIIDPKKRTAAVHTSPDHSEPIGIDGTLDGKDVLPGFAVSLAELFKTVDQMLGLS